MPSPYNPLDWYWYVGGQGPHLDDNGEYTGDDTRAYSSKANAYVAADDPAFIAWKDAIRAAAGVPPESAWDPTTRIDTEENLAAVLEPYGITPAFRRDRKT